MSFFAAAKFWCRRARLYQNQAQYYFSHFYEADRLTATLLQHEDDMRLQIRHYQEENARLRREVKALCNWVPESTHPTFDPTKEFAGDFAVDITTLPLEAGAVDPTRRCNSAGETIAELHLPGGRTRHAKVDNLRRCFGLNDEPPAHVNVLLDIGAESDFPFLHRSPVPGDLWYWSPNLETEMDRGPWEVRPFSKAFTEANGALVEVRPTDRWILEQWGY